MKKTLAKARLDRGIRKGIAVLGFSTRDCIIKHHTLGVSLGMPERLDADQRAFFVTEVVKALDDSREAGKMIRDTTLDRNGLVFYMIPIFHRLVPKEPSLEDALMAEFRGVSIVHHRDGGFRIRLKRAPSSFQSTLQLMKSATRRAKYRPQGYGLFPAVNEDTGVTFFVQKREPDGLMNLVGITLEGTPTAPKLQIR